MTEEVRVTEEDVRRVAELANLELTPEEEPRMQKDLNAILQHIAQLNELDTREVPAMAKVGDILACDMVAGQDSSSRIALRLDSLRPSLDRAEVMASAPETDNRFFKVPKVIER